MQIDKIRAKLDTVTVERTWLDEVLKDRLDFGFDSIYFRYAEAIDELAAYKSKVDGTDPVLERQRMWQRKQHFYHALEQLVHAHSEEEK